jgi:hypothetical protein
MQEERFPLSDYDQLATGSIQHMIRSLGEKELQQVLDYERAHNNRTQIVEMMRQRLGELAHGARPAAGEQHDEPVEAQDTSKGSPVTPAGSPEPMHPPRHGTEGPGKAKGNRPRRQG